MTLAKKTGLSVVADGLTVTVPDSRVAREQKTLLDRVSFRIEPGEFICVLGPSGAGKSTFVRSLLGEREIASGRLLVGGHDVFREADSLRGAIGYVPQRDINPTALPVERALRYASEVRLPSQTSAAERWSAIDRVIAEVILAQVVVLTQLVVNLRRRDAGVSLEKSFAKAWATGHWTPGGLHMVGVHAVVLRSMVMIKSPSPWVGTRARACCSRVREGLRPWAVCRRASSSLVCSGKRACVAARLATIAGHVHVVQRWTGPVSACPQRRHPVSYM